MARNVQGHIGAESSEAKCQLAAKTDQKKAYVIKFERKEIQLSKEVDRSEKAKGRKKMRGAPAGTTRASTRPPNPGTRRLRGGRREPAPRLGAEQQLSQPGLHEHRQGLLRSAEHLRADLPVGRRDGPQRHETAFFTETHPGRRRAGPPDDDGGISAKCSTFAAGSAPNVARKCALCSRFQNLQDYRAAKPETTM